MSTTQTFHLPMIGQQYATNQHLTTQPDYLKQQNHHDNSQEQNDQYEDEYQSSRQKSEMHGYDDDDNDDNITHQEHRNKIKQAKHQRDSFDDEQINNRFEKQESKSDGRHSDGYHGDSEHRSSGENQDLGLSPRNQKKDHTSVKSKNKKNKQHRAELTIQKESISPTEITTLKIIQPEVVHNLPVQGPDGFLTAQPTPIPSGRVIASPIPGPRKDKNKTNHDKNENTTKEPHGKDGKTAKGSKKKRKDHSRSPSQERDSNKNVKPKEDKKRHHEEPPKEYEISHEDVEERSRYTQFPSPTKSARSHYPLYESEIDSGIADDLTTPPQGL
jgi:hypothetical protein